MLQPKGRVDEYCITCKIYYISSHLLSHHHISQPLSPVTSSLSFSPSHHPLLQCYMLQLHTFSLGQFTLMILGLQYLGETGKVRDICSQPPVGAGEGELSPKSQLGSAVAKLVFHHCHQTHMALHGFPWYTW